ncbi:MAG TPA: hypothetical protein VFU40_09330 [Gemmatimonadales bacterium]|nr:hypothetical protein [Gemmatimonadales bacterium]
MRPYCQGALRGAKRYGEELKRYGEELWLRGKRNPRGFALGGGAVVLTLVGAYALSATGAGRSLCPPASEGTTPPFLLLMDPVPAAAAGAKVEIHYDVCGLPSGTPYSGRVRLSQQKPGGKKAVKPKPLTVTFKHKADGPATRREQEVELGSAKPGAYTLELSVVDDQGRKRKKVQKVLIKNP